jgi:dipeptidyl-peptidase-4
MNPIRRVDPCRTPALAAALWLAAALSLTAALREAARQTATQVQDRAAEPALPDQAEAAAEQPAAEAGKLIELEDLFPPRRSDRVDFGGSEIRRVEWLDDQRFVVPERDEQGERKLKAAPVVVDARNGKETALYPRDALERAFTALPGVTAGDAETMSGHAELTWNADRTAAVTAYADDLFLWRRGGGASRLTAGPEPEEEADFSPDGSMVSFVRGGGLWLIDLATGRERALTTGGGGPIADGKLDWVYQEELYGRDDYRGYWWSPDSARIAFLRFDESPVPEWTITDHVPIHPKLDVYPYPLAGDPNPVVKLGVVPAVGGATVWVDDGRWRAADPLFVRVGWKPDSSRLVVEVQDREQTWLDLALADPADGAVSVLLRETTEASVERFDDPLRWLADGGFVWLSARTGWPHLYRYTAGGELAGAVTSGEWEVRSIYGVDEGAGGAAGAVYVSATLADPIGEQVYRVGLDGGEPVRISEREGTHQAFFSPDLRHYVDIWSDLTTPSEVRLHRADGSEVRVVDAPPSTLGDYRLGAVERHRVPTRDGFEMEAMLIKPPGFDPARRYPVLLYHYGGPHAPVVRDRWAGTVYLWHQMLAQRGYLIWMCDNRSASGKGYKPTWQAYGRMGVVELRDTEDGLDWLTANPWVDPERIGVWGWSYGGFMTSYALTHSTRFKLGVAGAPVTDWRLYDSIYTERFM